MGEGFNYLIISDLHLQEAEKNPAGRLFYFDQEFADFLRYYRLSTVEGRRWKLIIGGDLIEFYVIREHPDPDERLLRGTTLTPRDRRFSPGTAWQKSVWKLDLILRSHPQLLLALGRFIAAGHEIYILRGNHDLELLWPQVQEHFRVLIAEHHPLDMSYLEMKRLARDRIHFVPWFYLEPGILYVEHGHQYDEYCSNSRNLYPVLPKDPERIELAVSGFTMRYFAARIQNIDPAAMETMSSVPRYMKHLMLSRPGLVARIPAYYIEMLGRVMRKVDRPDPEREAFVEGMAAAVREDFLRTSGLDEDTLRKLESLARRPTLADRRSTIRVLCLDIFVALVANVGLAGTFALTGRRGTRVRRALVALAAIPLWGIAVGRRAARVNDHKNLREIARKIRDLFGVRFVVFGHSHDPDVLPLDAERRHVYFNVGTWLPRGGESQMIFLKVVSDPARPPSAHLMRWDRHVQHPEEVDMASYQKGRPEREEMEASVGSPGESG